MHLSTLVSLTTLFTTTLAATGFFNVLSVNLAGLPKFINDNGINIGKQNAAAMIGQRLARYAFNAIQVQENSNYHEERYAADNHRFRTDTSGGVPYGSGLSTLANFGWRDFRRLRGTTGTSTKEIVLHGKAPHSRE